MVDRKSEAESPSLINDPTKLAEREAANALDQFDWAMSEVGGWVSKKKPNLKISMLLRLHRKAMDGIDSYAGNFRPAAVAIKGSGHQPISCDDVPSYIEDMFEYLDSNWDDKTAIHLSSYVMWRLNWVHPFADGNGRTSRMLSYMVLCGSLGHLLPGTRTIPEQISEDKGPYYAALEAADKCYKAGRVDVSKMEKLLEDYLTVQLVEIHDQANGKQIVLPNETSTETTPEKRSIVDFIESKPAMISILIAVVALIVAFLLS
jgi:Fic family protein